MLKLTKRVFTWRPTSTIADYYERALYNHILSSQNPDDGMVCYYLTLKPGAHKVYSTPFDSFWCCVGTGIENHARYGEAIYFHDDDSIFVNLFIASELRWAEKGFGLQQLTDYPESDTARFTIRCEEPVVLTLRFRRPYWAERGVEILVNGQAESAAPDADGYVAIRRAWRSGDRVEVTMPMSLRLEPMPDDPNRVARMYGPLVLAGELGPEDDPLARDHDYVPVLITGGEPIGEWLRPVAGGTNAFRTADVGRPRDVTLTPFYRLHGKRYSVYWDIFTPEQWTAKQEAYRAEQERLARLEVITVDYCQPGEMQPERDHNMQGENTRNGEHLDRKWRDAAEGWFSYDMKVLPGEPMTLVCTYWGSEGGARTFDILVDGEVIATRSLGMDKPGEFFDESHELPEELTRGKDKVTVRFESHPGNMAGGSFGLRVVRTGGR